MSGAGPAPAMASPPPAPSKSPLPLASSLGRRSNEEGAAPAPDEGVVTSVGTGGGGVAIEEDDDGLKSAYLAELGIEEARSRDDLLPPPLPPPPMRVERRLPRPRFSLVERASSVVGSGRGAAGGGGGAVVCPSRADRSKKKALSSYPEVKEGRKRYSHEAPRCCLSLVREVAAERVLAASDRSATLSDLTCLDAAAVPVAGSPNSPILGIVSPPLAAVPVPVLPSLMDSRRAHSSASTASSTPNTCTVNLSPASMRSRPKSEVRVPHRTRASLRKAPCERSSR